MIILDVEATALNDFTLAPLDHQPELLELYAVKYNERLEGKGEVLQFKCKPRAGTIPEAITKITGITWDDVKDAKGFPGHYRMLCDFFLGERVVVAHNAPYDLGVLRWELTRMGKEFVFPWPPRQICTVELTQHLRQKDGSQKFFKLTELYLYLFNKELKQEHRAGSDTIALVAIVRELRKRGLWPKD